MGDHFEVAIGTEDSTLNTTYPSSSLNKFPVILKHLMTTFAIHLVTSTLATFVIATGMWMFKILILKVLDCRFHHKTFFQNMQNQISHEYVLQTLLRPTREFNDSDISTTGAHLKRIKGAFVNTMRLLCTRLHTISDALDSSNFGNERQVEHVISMVFNNLTKSEHRDILEPDLLRVMKEEEITDVLRLFEGAAETKSISEASLRKWMVKVSNDRKLVVHLLKYNSTVIEELNIVVLVNLSFLVALMWCVLMGFGATRFVVFISSDHLLLLVFIFGNFCKMICEGIMLAIVMHPFDIGDHCIIDKEQLVIEKIGLISTVFLKDNNRKVECLNSVLLTKFISNLNRSSELADSFDILVSSTTCLDTTAALKLKIEELLGSSPESWRAEHCLELTGIDDARPKYNLVITYARNFQNYNKKKSERSELIYKLRMLLEELNIQNFTIQ
ncbi:hypothetical protein POM88_045435 [Heracleum sosnowskyi]|uniref:Mechanosensitive ion channel MscS domain-containing protein n=1 Tax=Heracleum sosnowskyi TaxID=360622 RepID=A0AAD8M4Y3_9APIA|nr:hypothetical protein POM88_045435 [Heracleum sosnowskyi]